MMDTTLKYGVKGGIVAILVVLLVVVPATVAYTLNNQINTLNTTHQNYVSTHHRTDTEYDSLNTAYQNYMSNHYYTNTEYDALNVTYHDYISHHSYTNLEHLTLTSVYDTVKNERDELVDIIELKKSIILIDRQTINQPAGYYTYWNFTIVGYAGYVSVDVHSSTTNTTFVQVIYNAYSVNFNDKIDVSVNGTAVFPVLPTDNVQVRIGNMNLITGATETITVTYHY